MEITLQYAHKIITYISIYECTIIVQFDPCAQEKNNEKNICMNSLYIPSIELFYWLLDWLSDL